MGNSHSPSGNPSPRPTDTARRGFLLATGAGTAGAVIAIATSGKPVAPVADGHEALAMTAGLTAHMQKYYRTTLV
jgi:hypothetical protein